MALLQILDLTKKACRGQTLQLVCPEHQNFRKKFYNIDTWLIMENKEPRARNLLKDLKH